MWNTGCPLLYRLSCRSFLAQPQVNSLKQIKDYHKSISSKRGCLRNSRTSLLDIEYHESRLHFGIRCGFSQGRQLGISPETVSAIVLAFQARKIRRKYIYNCQYLYNFFKVVLTCNSNCTLTLNVMQHVFKNCFHYFFYCFPESRSNCKLRGANALPLPRPLEFSSSPSHFRILVLPLALSLPHFRTLAFSFSPSLSPSLTLALSPALALSNSRPSPSHFQISDFPTHLSLPRHRTLECSSSPSHSGALHSFAPKFPWTWGIWSIILPCRDLDLGSDNGDLWNLKISKYSIELRIHVIDVT